MADEDEKDDAIDSDFDDAPKVEADSWLLLVLLILNG